MPAARPDKPLGLSFFFPAYNDGGTIASLVIRAVQAISRLTPDFEVIIVNDGSEDSTAEIADELARTYPQVKVVHHRQNRGYGGALRTGFSTASSPSHPLAASRTPKPSADRTRASRSRVSMSSSMSRTVLVRVGIAPGFSGLGGI